MLDKFDIIFSQLPTDEETLRAKRQLPAELQDVAERELKRVVLDPEKSKETIKELILLAVESESEEEKFSASSRSTRRIGPSQPIHLGPEVGIEPCVRITIGFIYPCGTLRIGGCS